MIVVTGAAGFIGSCIVKKLNDEGHTNIICVDRFRDGEKWLNLRGLKFYEFAHADEFVEPEILNSIFDEGVTAIYHMGACSSTTEKNVDFLWKNNVEFSQILFRYASEYDTPICYASSAATYGAGENGYDDNEAEISKLMPLNPYGYSKQVFDEWVLKQLRTPKKWFGVKFFNVYGPNEYHKGKMRSVVHQAFGQIKETGKMKLFKSYNPDFKDGEQLRDFVYVKDVVEAMYQLMNDGHTGANGIYNLGTGKARSFVDLVKATFAAMGEKEDIEFVEMPENLRGQYQYFTEAKMDKLYQALPNFKFHSLEEGVKDYVQNHLQKDNPRLVFNQVER
ncbi:MAG: ADP-glyceromanno-heptose 6-epimerase [Halobacteriovoraceae bacterium]|nr:ADP-glyceromanno-heptose 6-epimerase [Halobacteriovoraceae bacterium]|tara:strand:+ start:110478 stop:111482 length:1005 start_codon:yes stop_codon:yes gene_type:complete